MSDVVAGRQGKTFAPLPARLCIDAKQSRIRRYAKNTYGRVFATDEWDVLNWDALSVAYLADLLVNPR